MFLKLFKERTLSVNQRRCIYTALILFFMVSLMITSYLTFRAYSNPIIISLRIVILSFMHSVFIYDIIRRDNIREQQRNNSN